MIKARFASGTTRLLDVAQARIALANFLFARHHGGRVLLRFDDCDGVQSKTTHAESVVHDLRWLGIEWDERLHQSNRLSVYETAAEQLKQAGRLYPCFETEVELRAKRDQRIKRGLPSNYDRA